MREEKPLTKSESAQEKPIAYIPRHLRQEVASPTIQQTTTPKAVAQSSSAQPTKEPPPAVNKPVAQQPTGLHTPIQTPAQKIAAQSRRQNEQSPLARQQPQNRRESPTEAVESNDDSLVDLGGDENYGLNSEDDAFLAAVDLGDGDLGRPINFEEGLGGVSVMDDSSLDQERPAQSAEVKLPVIRPGPQVGVSGATGSSEPGAQIRRAVTLPNKKTAERVDPSASSSSSVASDVARAAVPAGLPRRPPVSMKSVHAPANVSILSRECHPFLSFVTEAVRATDANLDH